LACSRQSPNENECLYKTDDAFWVEEFVTDLDRLDAYAVGFFSCAESIAFEP